MERTKISQTFVYSTTTSFLFTQPLIILRAHYRGTDLPLKMAEGAHPCVQATGQENKKKSKRGPRVSSSRGPAEGACLVGRVTPSVSPPGYGRGWPGQDGADGGSLISRVLL